MPARYGARQDINHPHPTFRRLAERLIRRMVPRYAEHPAVIGWQVDNEPGINILHNPDVFDGFREYLRERYGDVEELNRRWGLTYWSHRLHDWADLWPPDGNSTPPYDLAWRRYQAELTHEYIAWQTELVRSLVPEHHFITTCLALHQPTQDVAAIGAPLDIVSTNVYYGAQDRLAVPGDDALTAEPQPSFLPWSGTAWLYLQLDISRTRQAPFLIAETNAVSIGGSAENHPPYRGQLGRRCWRSSRAARAWSSTGTGTRSTTEPRCTGAGSSATASSRAASTRSWRPSPASSSAPSRRWRGLQARSDVAVLVSAESRWAMEFVGPLQSAVKAWMGDPQSYERLLAAFYRGLFDAGLSVDVVAPDQLPDDAAAMAARWPVLVVPGLYVASDALLERLRRYAEVGGHLVLTRAPATPTRTPSRATWSCPASCARPPGSPRATRPGDDLACATHLVHCYA